MKILIIPEYGKIGGGTLTFLIKLLDINYRVKNKIILVIEKNKKLEIIEKLINKYDIEIIEIPDRPKLFYKPYFSVLFELRIWFISIYKKKYDFLFVSNGTPWLNIGFLLVSKKMIYFMHTYPVKGYSCKSSLMYYLSKFVSKILPSSSIYLVK